MVVIHHIVFVVLCLIFGFPVRASVPSQHQSVGLWPIPRSVSMGNKTLLVDASSFQLSISKGSSPTLEAAIQRYTRIILLHGRSTLAQQVGEILVGCTLSVSSTTEQLALDMDEGYQLTVDAGACSIHAANFVGALRALETLSQLVLSDAGTYGSEDARYWIPSAPWSISDHPRFPYRGLMVDTARHWLPLNALRRQIDALAFNKMNVLHWHMTDAQSTPFDSATFPKLKEGAFAPRAVYSPLDIKDIVEYARLRGVQILMEIDMPGHSYAFGIGYPELIVNCSAMYPLETEFWCSSLNPSRPELYTWLQALLRELVDLLPNTLFHIGGDEVQYQCWKTDPAMVAYLASRNMTGVQLYQEFEYKMFDMLAKLGRKPVTWDSTFFSGMKLPVDAIVHQYQGGSDAVAKIAKSGTRVIASGLPGDYVASQASWQSIFQEEIMPANLTLLEQKNVLGGAACMWGETMDDSDIDTIVWPDACAVAERLWSSPGDTNPDAYDTNTATLRLFPQRCRLYQRGIRAKPIDARDVFGRRRLQAQCEVLLPKETAASLPPLTLKETYRDDRMMFV